MLAVLTPTAKEQTSRSKITRESHPGARIPSRTHFHENPFSHPRRIPEHCPTKYGTDKRVHDTIGGGVPLAACLPVSV